MDNKRKLNPKYSRIKEMLVPTASSIGKYLTL